MVEKLDLTVILEDLIKLKQRVELIVEDLTTFEADIRTLIKKSKPKKKKEDTDFIDRTIPGTIGA